MNHHIENIVLLLKVFETLLSIYSIAGTASTYGGRGAHGQATRRTPTQLRTNPAYISTLQNGRYSRSGHITPPAMPRATWEVGVYQGLTAAGPPVQRSESGLNLGSALTGLPYLR